MDTKLYRIIKSLQVATSDKEKRSILSEHKDSLLLKNFMRSVFDPNIQFYIKRFPSVERNIFTKLNEFSQDTLDSLYKLSSKEFTGDEARQFLRHIIFYLDKESEELVEMVVKKNLKTTLPKRVLFKVWPDLFFVPPYMRYSTLDDVTKEHFNSVNKIIVQEKIECSFMYVLASSEGWQQSFNRYGVYYPIWFTEILTENIPVVSEDKVFMGGCVLYLNGTEISKQESNVILSKITNGEPECNFKDITFKMFAWDVVNKSDFDNGVSYLPYSIRLATINLFNTKNMSKIDFTVVNSLKEALDIYSSQVYNNVGGVMIKDAASIWENKLSLSNIKMKF